MNQVVQIKQEAASKQSKSKNVRDRQPARPA